jgi:hypothetical protein
MRIIEIDVLRAAAILFVLMAHIYSQKALPQKVRDVPPGTQLPIFAGHAVSRDEYEQAETECHEVDIARLETAQVGVCG